MGQPAENMYEKDHEHFFKFFQQKLILCIQKETIQYFLKSKSTSKLSLFQKWQEKQGLFNMLIAHFIDLIKFLHIKNLGQRLKNRDFEISSMAL